MVIILAVIEPLIATDKPKSTQDNIVKRRFYLRPYCGIYCLYSAIKLVGKESDIKELIKPEYFSSQEGSSLKDLKNAAIANGSYAESVDKLTKHVLEVSPYPVILHVKSTPDNKEYDHYVLFVGTEDGQVKLFDPPKPVKLVPFRNLAPLWDGTGLVISDEPIILKEFFAPAYKRLIAYTAIGLATILLFRWIRRRWFSVMPHVSRYKLFGLSIVQGVGLAFASIFFGMLYHFVNDDGFLAHANATSPIIEAHQGNFIPKISKKKVEKLIGTNTVFIDARRTRDFEAEHLKGAISIPVNSSIEQRQQAMTGITKNAKIVVYCQSGGCQYAEIIAIKLIADGFTNVSLFKGGWREWIDIKTK